MPIRGLEISPLKNELHHTKNWPVTLVRLPITLVLERRKDFLWRLPRAFFQV
jgi:hypothetical protein